MNSTFKIVRIFVVLQILAMVGCSASDSGPRRYEISGTVSLDGELLKKGEILFLPTDGGSSLSGVSISDGNFRILRKNGLLSGQYKVSISSTELRPLPNGATSDLMGDTMQAIEIIPKRYNQKSELLLNVHGDDDIVVSYELNSR